MAATTLPTTGSLSNLAAQFDKTPDTVVADVNGTPITLGMVADRLRDFPEKLSVLPSSVVYKSALDDLVEQRALAVKAKELGLDKRPETKRRLDEATDQALAQALIRHITPELVTDKAIEDRYNNTIAGKPGPEEVRFRVIATATETDGKIVLERLGNGTDFAGLARAVSKDPSAFNGGEIGFAARDQLTPEIGAVVFSLMPGQTTAFPIPSHNLWFVIQVEGRRQLGAPSLAESRNRLTNDLTKEAAAEIIRKTRAAVAVNNYGPTGMQGQIMGH
ncbi:MAG TPA: hypothetical protein DDZ81_04110 [Acetobacteraceae bacterium]|nr:hypothetical protein [Acetobacteraceae bacterium]